MAVNARKKGERQPPPIFVRVLPTEITLDEDWNSRREYTRTEGEAADPSDLLTDEQLEESIRQHGILEAPAVMSVDGTYKAVYGYRRIRAAQRVRPTRKITVRLIKDGPQRARAYNLVENLHRRALKPWEIAEALYQMKLENPVARNEDLAALVNLSKTFVMNLLVLRTRADPVIWEQFKRWGTSLKIGYREVLAISKLPQCDQAAAWKAAVERQKQRPVKKYPETRRPGKKRLERVIESLDLLDYSDEWKSGARWALHVALGNRDKVQKLNKNS